MNEMKDTREQENEVTEIQIDDMTYRVRVHFNDKSRDNLEKKLIRLIRNEAKTLDFTDDSEGVLKSP